jgi:lysophospholipase L1-like esterase
MSDRRACVRRWFVVWIFPATLVAVGCSSNTSPTPAVPTVAPGVWAVLGSSITAGQGASAPSLAWVAQVGATYAPSGVTVTNLGIGGSQTWQWLPSGTANPPGKPAPYGNNIDAALALNPKVLMMSASTNDLANGSTADDTINNLTTLRNYAVARGVTVIVQGPIPRTSGLTDAQRATLPSIDQRARTLAGTCFTSLLTSLGTADYKLASQYDVGDGVHTNDAGHAVIFRATDDLLKSGTCVAKPK